MKELYYYHRDVNYRPVETVCLLSTSNGEHYSRGIALCSPEDSPCKKFGRKVARGRAMKALLNGKEKLYRNGRVLYERMPALYPIEKRWIERLRNTDSLQ